MIWTSLRDHPERRGISAVKAWLCIVVVMLVGGCESPSAHTFTRDFLLRDDLPVDPPHERGMAEDDRINGGRLFKYYCGSCHNARPLGERPFSNYHVALTHMRQQAYLTGKEYRQIMYFLRRWNDIGPATPEVEPSPKRFVYSQPIADLRREPAPAAANAPPPQGPGPWRQPIQAVPAPAQPPAAGLPAPIQ
jgi:hypothetical protein